MVDSGSSIYDTKQIAASNSRLSELIPSTHCGDLYQTLSAAPFASVKIALDAEFARYKDGQFAHEAGYDALMCGTSFVQMRAFLSHLNEDIGAYVNRVHLMRSDIASGFVLCGTEG